MISLQSNEKKTKSETDDVIAGMNSPDQLFIVSSEAKQCEQNGSQAVVKHVLHEWNKFTRRILPPRVNHSPRFLQLHKTR